MRKGNPGVFSTLKNLIDVQEDALILTYKGMIGVRKLSVSQMNNLIQSAILSKNPLVLTNLLHVLEHFPPESIYPLYNLAEEKHLYGMGDILYDHPIFGPAIENEFGKDIKHKIEAIKTNAIKSRYTGQKINLSEINQLIELNLESKFLWYFYCDFYEKCLELKGSLTKDKIDKMYYAFIEVLYNLKLDLYDSQQGAYHQKLTLVRPIPFEGKNRVIWTPEQEAASLVFIEKLNKIFSPFVKDLSPMKINLYSEMGSLQAKVSGAHIVDDFYLADLIDKVQSHLNLFFRHPTFNNQSPPYHEHINNAFHIMIWSTISVQYTLNMKNENVDVFLPNGEITLSSIFWNYELNTIRQLELASRIKQGLVNFYKLTPSAKQEALSIQSKMSEIKKKLATQPKNSDLNQVLANLENQEYDLYENKNNWEKVSFENLAFKGLKVGDQPYTVKDLKKISNQLTTFSKKLQDRKNKTATSNPRAAVISSYHKQKATPSSLSKRMSTSKSSSKKPKGR